MKNNIENGKEEMSPSERILQYFSKLSDFEKGILQDALTFRTEEHVAELVDTVEVAHDLLKRFELYLKLREEGGPLAAAEANYISDYLTELESKISR